MVTRGNDRNDTKGMRGKKYTKEMRMIRKKRKNDREGYQARNTAASRTNADEIPVPAGRRFQRADQQLL